MSRVVAVCVVGWLAACGSIVVHDDGPASDGGDGGKSDGGTSDGAASTGGSSAGDGSPEASASASAGDTGPLDGRVCSGVEFATDRLAVDTYLLFDASSAMDEPVRPSRSGSWWTELGSALSLYVTEPRANGVQTALNFFPVAAALPQACGPGYEVPRVPYAALPEVGEELLAAYAGRTPAGPNTAGPALAEALAYAKARAYGRPGALPAVVLVTRGMPRDCALTDLAELARQGFENEPKARTSVVVLGASRDLAELHGVAASGGSEEAIVLPGDDPSKEFVEAMLRVQNGTGPCKYSIPELEGEPTLLRVFLSIGRERVILSRVEDRAACGQGGEGYYYDDNTAPLPFVLCPASCARKGDGKLSLEYGCD